MPVPTTDVSPNRYQPNPQDDRAIREASGDGPDATAYFSIASALDALDDVFGREEGRRSIFIDLDPQTRKALRSADKALRRAGFSLVVHAAPRS